MDELEQKGNGKELLPIAHDDRISPSASISQVFTHIARTVDGRFFLALSGTNMLAGVSWLLWLPVTSQMPLGLFLIPIVSFLMLLWSQESFGNLATSFGIFSRCVIQVVVAVTPWYWVFKH